MHTIEEPSIHPSIPWSRDEKKALQRILHELSEVHTLLHLSNFPPPPWPLNIYLMPGDVLSLTLLQRFPIAIDVIKSISEEFTKAVSLAKWQIKLQLKNKFNPCIGIPPTH